MRVTLPKLLLFVFPFLLLLFLIFTQTSKASLANHIVISEVQIEGVTATDEFVELYNPTGSAIDLTGYRLSKKTSGGSLSNLLTSMSGTIPAHGFFLITHPTGYTGISATDATYSTASSMAADNTVILFSDAGVTVADKVGLGAATDFETATTTNPSSGTSIERKAQVSSNSLSMGIGGADENFGNAEDSDNNASDFIERSAPQPQNTNSAIEVLDAVTPTPTATAEPTQTPTPTPVETSTSLPTPTATIEPTLTPVPTETPTPTTTPTVEPTVVPTPTATSIPTPTVEPTTTPTPIATQVPTTTPTSTPTGKNANPVFTCQNTHIPNFVYALLKMLMPEKFNC